MKKKMKRNAIAAKKASTKKAAGRKAAVTPVRQGATAGKAILNVSGKLKAELAAGAKENGFSNWKAFAISRLEGAEKA